MFVSKSLVSAILWSMLYVLVGLSVLILLGSNISGTVFVAVTVLTSLCLSYIITMYRSIWCWWKVCRFHDKFSSVIDNSTLLGAALFACSIFLMFIGESSKATFVSWIGAAFGSFALLMTPFEALSEWLSKR